MKRVLVVVVAMTAFVTAATAGAAPPQGVQSDSSFALSYAAKTVSSVSATTQRVSCYAPEVTFFGALGASNESPGGGMSACPRATTGEQTQGFATQDAANPPMLVKDHSESDVRVDP